MYVIQYTYRFPSDRTWRIRFSDLLFSYRLISDCLQSEKTVWNHRQSRCSARPGLMACVHVYFSRATLSHVYCRIHFFFICGKQCAADRGGHLRACRVYTTRCGVLECYVWFFNNNIVPIQYKCVRFIFSRGTPLRYDCAFVSWKLRATMSVEEKTDITDNAYCL